jgi:Uma2 family endonuclease
VYRPDIAVYLAARMPRLPERLVTPPDLIVEVLSPSTMPLDLITKRDDYGGFGVEEYWVVDPADGSLRAWTRGAGGMMAVDVQGGAFASARLAGLTIDLAALRASCR